MSSPKPVTKLIQTQKKENITVCLLKIHFSVKYEKKYGKYDTFVACFDINLLKPTGYMMHQKV